MPGTLKEPPEWYNDEETLKKLLAIVIAALCVRLAFFLSDYAGDDRIVQQPSGAVIRRFP